jgi:hypothetical protein
MKLKISAPPMPNPSIEGMPKRLRLSVTPHVKRYKAFDALILDLGTKSRIQNAVSHLMILDTV